MDSLPSFASHRHYQVRKDRRKYNRVQSLLKANTELKRVQRQELANKDGSLADDNIITAGGTEEL